MTRPDDEVSVRRHTKSFEEMHEDEILKFLRDTASTLTNAVERLEVLADEREGRAGSNIA